RSTQNVLLEAAIAQRSVVFAAQVPHLVQQGLGDRLVELGAVLDRAQEISTIKDDGAVPGLALHGRALRRRRVPLARPPRRRRRRRLLVVIERQAPEQPQDGRRQRRLLRGQVLQVRQIGRL